MIQITTLKEQFAAVSTDFALTYLIQKGASQKCFYWSGQMWTPLEARDEWEDYLLKMPCNEFGVVRFYGGPPGRGKWFDGTILSMLCDLILFDDNTQDLVESEKLSA